MDIDDVNRLCQAGEGADMEFKTTTGEIKAAFRTLCGFLNSGGGKVLIGVRNNGDVYGQDVSDGTQQEVARETAKLEPVPSVVTDWIEIPSTGRKVIVLTAVPSDELVPYSYEGRAYERVENTTSLMSQQRYQELLLRRTQSHSRWETGIANGVRVEDLDREEILRTARLGIEAGRLPEESGRETRDILQRLSLLLDGTPTNAAVVLFGQEMLPYFPQCVVRMAQFRGLDKSEFLDNRQALGNAFTLLNEALLFLRRHLPVAGRVQPGLFEREDEPLFPLEALREALVNAICHRDYSVPGGAVTLAIFDDRLEIWNDGALPPGISVEDLKRDHPSRLRNPLIANVLYKRRLVESWGRGTQKIVELCVRAGHPEPEFLQEAGSVGVRFLPRGYIAPHRVPYDLTPRQREILQVLARGEPLALRDVSEILAEENNRASIQQDLRHLKQLGLVDARGHARGAVWFLAPKRSTDGSG